MKTLIAICLLIGTMAPAYAATAYWTGQSQFITTITYQPGVKCEYNYMGQTFWRVYTGALCPNNGEVQ